jgi:hypothetical protein
MSGITNLPLPTNNNFRLNNFSSFAKGGETITVVMKGETPEAHAQAILDNFKFNAADEKKFKETFGYDLRKSLTDGYRNKDNKTSHKPLGKGLYQTTIPIDKRMLAQIREIKPEAKKPAKVKVEAKPTTSPSNPNEAIAGKNGVNNGASQRTKLNKQLAEAENAKMARLINDAQIIPTGIMPRKLSDLQTFNVKVPEGTTADQKDKVLLSHIDKQYSDRIPFAQNRQNILAEAKLKGVDIQNVKVENGVATFDISVENMLKLHTSFIGERASINQAEAAYDKFANKNEISQFLSGLVTGSGKAIAGTANLVIDLPGTLNTLYQVVSSPVETFNALYKELGETWDEFKNAESSKKANMIGELVGGAVTEFFIGKGIGKAAGILAKTKTGAALLAKAENTAVAVTAKVANKFSDEAAGLAGERARKALATTVYSGIPVDVLADMAVVAGNKISKGAVKFGEFSTQMVEKFGEKVKPYIEKLYREQMIELNLADKIDEVGIKSTNINKLSKTGFYTEKIKWGNGNIDARPDGVGFWGKRTPQSNPRVNNYELKINPNNESYYIKHPDGRYVQFENLKRETLQDGKLVMQVNKSIYRVYDKPTFLRTNILNEAKKQVEAAKFNKLEVEWLISDKETLSQLKRFFKENNIDIKLTYLPE